MEIQTNPTVHHETLYKMPNMLEESLKQVSCATSQVVRNQKESLDVAKIPSLLPTKPSDEMTAKLLPPNGPFESENINLLSQNVPEWILNKILNIDHWQPKPYVIG